ncbi:MAG: hypothetical protein HY551_03210 [Elusimicrobia bacterium]|nr:hypothetical protein [Elusimicrobiota bacterium]
MTRLLILRLSAWLALSGCLLAPAWSFSPEGYPGSTWGNGTRDLNGFEGYGTQGKVHQSIQWLTLPGAITAKTFAAYRWRIRTQNRNFYDARGPAVGVEFTKSFVDFGADFSWQRFPGLNRTSEDFQLFVTWYKRVNLLEKSSQANIFGLPILGLPLSTWGRLSHDLNNIEGDGAQGFVAQGVEWFRMPGDIVFRTLASYRWRFRSENRQYYNTHGPAVGVELGRKTVDVGVEFIWRRYPELPRSSRDFQLYLTWYFDWDLKNLASRTSPNP